MAETTTESKVRTSALVLLDPETALPIVQELAMVGWTVIPFDSSKDLVLQDIEKVGCLLLDTGRRPAFEQVLHWCEKNEPWKSFPKVLVGFSNQEATSAVRMPRHEVPERLIARLMQAQNQFRRTEARGIDRRRFYRHRCNLPSTIQHSIRILDISAGGAALEMCWPPPTGMHLKLHVADDDPLLNWVEGEVLSARVGSEGNWCVHFRFVNVSSVVEKALQRHVLALQTRRSQ